MFSTKNDLRLEAFSFSRTMKDSSEENQKAPSAAFFGHLCKLMDIEYTMKCTLIPVSHREEFSYVTMLDAITAHIKFIH